MAQSKRHSIIETLVNAVTGYMLALVLNYYLVPLFYPGTIPSVSKSFWLTVIFTGASMVRTYVFRRLFVRWEILCR